MTNQQPNAASGTKHPRRTRGRTGSTAAPTDQGAGLAGGRGADDTRDELDLLLTTLPRRTSYLSRVLYRTRGSALPRGMRSVVFTLAFGPLRISEIAWEEGIGQPAATRMVARLEALGLVSRERSEADGRIVMVALTDSGRAELEALREQSRRLLREALRGRSASEVRRLRAASEALALLTDWVLEQESAVYGTAQRVQSTGGVNGTSKRDQTNVAANDSSKRSRPSGAGDATAKPARSAGAVNDTSHAEPPGAGNGSRKRPAAKRAQSTSDAASRPSTRRALRS